MPSNSSPIFILGHPRSGTTLLQRMLNACPDCLIYGEHLGIIAEISRGYYRVVNNSSALHFIDHHDKTSRLRVKDAWIATHSGLTRTHLIEVTARYIEDMLNIEKFDGRWGFKEVRYGFGDNVAGFLLELFPSAKLIFMVRNPVDQIQSKLQTRWWPGETLAEHIDAWTAQAICFQDSNLAFHGRSRIIRFEEITTDPLMVSKLAEWLDIPARALSHVAFEVPPVKGPHLSIETELSQDDVTMIKTRTRGLLGYSLT